MTARFADGKNEIERQYVGLDNDAVVFANAGVPVNGTSGTGVGIAGPGSLCIDRTTTTAKLYINTNTKASPTWIVVGAQIA